MPSIQNIVSYAYPDKVTYKVLAVLRKCIDVS